MDSIRGRKIQIDLMSLEAAAASARAGFACMFSTSEEYETALISERRAQGRYDRQRSSEEYETALISERRAQGRYDRQRSRWPAIMFIGGAMMVAGTVLLLN